MMYTCHFISFTIHVGFIEHNTKTTGDEVSDSADSAAMTRTTRSPYKVLYPEADCKIALFFNP